MLTAGSRARLLFHFRRFLAIAGFQKGMDDGGVQLNSSWSDYILDKPPAASICSTEARQWWTVHHDKCFSLLGAAFGQLEWAHSWSNLSASSPAPPPLLRRLVRQSAHVLIQVPIPTTLGSYSSTEGLCNSLSSSHCATVIFCHYGSTCAGQRRRGVCLKLHTNSKNLAVRRFWNDEDDGVSSHSVPARGLRDCDGFLEHFGLSSMQ